MGKDPRKSQSLKHSDLKSDRRAQISVTVTLDNEQTSTTVERYLEHLNKTKGLAKHPQTGKELDYRDCDVFRGGNWVYPYELINNGELLILKPKNKILRKR